MKLREGNVFIGLCRVPSGGWRARVEAWTPDNGGADVVAHECLFDAEPAYDSFVVSIGELVAEMLGEPE